MRSEPEGRIDSNVSEPEGGLGPSEDDREARHPAPADPGPGSGVPAADRSTSQPETPEPRPTRSWPCNGRLLPPGEGRQGPDPPLPEQGDRPHHARRSPACCTSTGPQEPSPTAAAPGIPSHAATPRPTSGCSLKSMPSTAPAAVGPASSRPGLAAVRRPPLRAPRRHLQRTPLQPAPLDQLQRLARDDARADPPRAHRHRRAAPAPALRTTRLPAGRFVHQGDLDGKGLYHLNLVDEVTQFQFVGSVERIDTPCLAPVLEALLRAFPFNVRGFHTDNGSEFINHKIVARLQALHIDEFTKSRPRRSNDNALVESKTARSSASTSDTATSPAALTRQRLHPAGPLPLPELPPPRLFPVDEVDAKGRVRKRYPHAQRAQCPTPPPASSRGRRPARRRRAAMSDNDAARALNQARDRLFVSIDPAA